MALLTGLWLWPFAGGPSSTVDPLLWGIAVSGAWLLLSNCQFDLDTTGWTLPLAALVCVVGWALLNQRMQTAGAIAGLLIAWAGFAGTQAARRAGRSAVQTIASAWLLAGLLSSAMAVLQYTGQAELFSPWINTVSDGRAFANLRQPNQFATLTMIALMGLLHLLASEPAGATRLAWPVFAAVLLAVGNAMSSSRTGMVQLVGIVAVAWIWRLTIHAPVRKVLLALALSYIAAAIALMSAEGMGAPAQGALIRAVSESGGCQDRSILWSNVLHLIGLRPWLGWGWGELDYAHYVTLYDEPRFCAILDNAHNLPLHLAVELGVPLALAACGLIVWGVWRARPWRETVPSRQLAWGVLALIGVHSLLEYPLWYAPFQLAVGICLGLLWPRDVTAAEASPRARGIALALPVALLIGCALVAWDYRRVSQIYLPVEARAAAYREDTLAKVRGSWFFREQALFAELTLTPLTRENADWSLRSAMALLHYSPEPRVIEKVIESAVMLGRDDIALVHLARYRAAFPAEHARWAQAQAEPLAESPAFKN